MANRPTLLMSPAEKFRISGVRIKNHQTMVDSEPFQTGLDAALAQFAFEQARGVTQKLDDFAMVGIANAALQRFIVILKTISEEPPPKPAPPAAAPALDQKA